ncbi:MAG: hypothetical protein ABIK68_05355 [bacterium]
MDSGKISIDDLNGFIPERTQHWFPLEVNHPLSELSLRKNAFTATVPQKIHFEIELFCPGIYQNMKIVQNFFFDQLLFVMIQLSEKVARCS